jgi:hypothetical protein
MPRKKTGRKPGRPRRWRPEHFTYDADWLLLYRMLEGARGQPKFRPYALATQVSNNETHRKTLVAKLKDLLVTYSLDHLPVTDRTCEIAQWYIEDRLIYSCLTEKEGQVFEDIENVFEKLEERALEVGRALGKPALRVRDDWIADFSGAADYS